MNRGIESLYAQFKADERFRLVIAALARGDLTEADRLIDHCPSKTYRMPDAAFTEATRGLHVLALQAQCWLLRAQGAALLVLSLLASTQSDTSRDQDRFDRLSDSLLALDTQIVSIWTAWTQFCERIGIDPDDAMMLTGSKPLSFKLGVTGEYLSEELANEYLEPDPEQVGHFLDFFDGYWKRVENYAPWRR